MSYTCVVCGAEITSYRSTLYCSETHQRTAAIRRYRKRKAGIAVAAVPKKKLARVPELLTVEHDPDEDAGLLPGLTLPKIETETMLKMRSFTDGTLLRGTGGRRYMVEGDSLYGLGV